MVDTVPCDETRRKSANVGEVLLATGQFSTYDFAMTCRALIILLLSGNALGCSMGSTPYPVSRVFRIHVTNDFGAVSGLRLRVYRFKSEEFQSATREEIESSDSSRFQDVIARAVADENGNAEFALDRTGRFWMSPEGTVGGWTQIELEVSDKAGLSTVEMTWPGQGKWHPILQTAHLRGHITTGLSSSHSIPLQDNPLILRAALDYTPIATTRTKKDGSFEFADVAPGLYFVQIVSTPEQGRWALRGDIPLYVATTARETLAISTEFTSCGLNYDLEENKSRHQPVACSKGGKLVPCE
jgi:hypothetical protein